jgi:hypothetical protein
VPEEEEEDEEEEYTQPAANKVSAPPMAKKRSIQEVEEDPDAQTQVPNGANQSPKKTKV